MKRILVTILLTLFFSVGAVEAVTPDDQPFVNLSITPDILDLGTLPFFMSTYDSPAVLIIKVESNCFHGPVLASITSLKHTNGSTITPDRIFIKAPTTGGFVPMVKPVAISEQTTGSHDIVLNFRVENKFLDMAGRYTGTITFTIVPPSF